MKALTMRHSIQHCTTLAGMLLLAIGWPLAVQGSPQLVIDKGCYNCHGSYLRSDAPSIERLSRKLSKFKGDPVAEQKFVDKYRAGEMFQHIDVHERLSAESAKVLIHWLVEGAK